MNPEEFPRPCKNCGQKIVRWRNGELRHVQNRSSSCPGYRDAEIVRDAKGRPSKMLFGRFIVRPDPPTPEEIDAQKLMEWESIYGEAPKEK